MKLMHSLVRSLRMLRPRDQRLLLLIIPVQSALAVLDLIAVALIGLVGLVAVGAGSGQLPPLANRGLVAVGAEDVDPYLLAVVLGGLAALLMVSKSVLSLVVNRRVFVFLANRQADISSRLASQMLARPLLDVLGRSSQDSAYSVTLGVNSLTMGVIGQSTILAAEVTLMTVLTIGLLLVDPVLTLVVMVFFSLVAVAMYLAMGGWGARLGRSSSTLQIDSVESMQQLIRSYREISVAGRRSSFVEQFSALRWEFARVQANLQLLSQIPKYALEVALIVGGVALAGAQFLTRDVAAAVATIALYLTAASRLMPSLLRLQTALVWMRANAGLAQPTLELDQELSRAGLVASSDVSLPQASQQQLAEGLANGFPDFTPLIECCDVRMTYPGADRPALADFTVTVPPATSLALVGTTGAGKSTAADLILGALSPDSGTIRVSGLKPASASLKWPGAMAYVPQEIAMMNGTIRENIALGLPSGLVTDDQVWDALERAQLAAMLKSERVGLDTVVGEHGVKLSGGQRQRLGIARALLTHPQLLVLDEATSALDAETESAVTQALRQLSDAVSLVVIAHRLATVSECDQVAFLEGGRLVALGTFDEVRREVPAFDRQAALLRL